MCSASWKSRYVTRDGDVMQVEMFIGDTELWFSGHGEGWWEKKGGRPDQFVGVWVDDVDAMYERVRAAGVEARAPEDLDYDVRSFHVRDPEGYLWGFMRRLNRGYTPSLSAEEGGWIEIKPSGDG